jgi:hypothetical protein
MQHRISYFAKMLTLSRNFPWVLPYRGIPESHVRGKQLVFCITDTIGRLPGLLRCTLIYSAECDKEYGSGIATGSHRAQLETKRLC